MTNMKKSTINLMEEFIHEATPELILGIKEQMDT